MSTSQASEMGQCVVSWWDDPTEFPPKRRLRLDKADRDIQISDELLDELRTRGWVGEGIFVIEADNATARYALEEHNSRGFWTARRVGPDPLDSQGSAS